MIAWSFSFAMNSVIGTALIVHAESTGTMSSPCPPSTIARTSFTLTPASRARKSWKRAESSTPAIPATFSRGQPTTRLYS